MFKKGFSDFFEKEQADIFCLQEVKATIDQIPYHPKDYYCYINSAERKGYSGTLIYSKIKPIEVTYGIGIEKHDHEGRTITAEYQNYYLVNVYTPNAKRNLECLNYRIDWEEDLKKYLKSLEKEKPVIVCGDFNVAHEEIYLKNPKQNIGNAGFTYEERDCFTRLLDSGFIDTFRYFNPDKEAYTWWSYMAKSRENNIGWRIDYFLVSKCFIPKVKTYIIIN